MEKFAKTAEAEEKPEYVQPVLFHVPTEYEFSLEEWDGMPEFVQENEESIRDIIIHFRSQEDIVEFSELMKQKITDATKYLWYPENQIKAVIDKRWVDSDWEGN